MVYGLSVGCMLSLYGKQFGQITALYTILTINWWGSISNGNGLMIFPCSFYDCYSISFHFWDMFIPSCDVCVYDLQFHCFSNTFKLLISKIMFNPISSSVICVDNLLQQFYNHGFCFIIYHFCSAEMYCLWHCHHKWCFILYIILMAIVTSPYSSSITFGRLSNVLSTLWCLPCGFAL